MHDTIDLDTTVEPLEVPRAAARRGSILRAVFTVFVCAVVLLACLDLLGYRSRTLHNENGAVTTSVTYGQFTRRGITTNLRVEVDSETGFDGDVTVSLNEDYLQRLSIRHMSPEPDSETSEAGKVKWTFSQPQADQFSMDVDAEVDPSSSPGWIDGALGIAVADQPVDLYTFRTWIWP